ncbi:MAG: class II aldolase/adducin family protein [Phascolarctobacterium sp.]|nr:class II aldolase/adducin family protein [Phascolarctobacterium sp.]
MNETVLLNDKEISKEIILSAREAIVAMGKELIERKLVAGSWGNISVKIADGVYAVTPSGRGYANQKPEDIVIVDDACKTLDGELTPSSESKLHTAIYNACPEAKAIIHTHSIYASALAAMRKPVPAIIEDIVQIIGGRVECAEYALPGTQELADNAVKAMNGRKGVLLANHGAVCWGKDLADALMVCEILEKAAQIAIICQSCGGAVELSSDDAEIMHSFYEEHYIKRQRGEEK